MNWVGEYIGNGEYPTWSLVPKRFSVGQWLEAHSMQNILTERYHLRQYRSQKGSCRAIEKIRRCLPSSQNITVFSSSLNVYQQQRENCGWWGHAYLFLSLLLDARILWIILREWDIPAASDKKHSLLAIYHHVFKAKIHHLINTLLLSNSIFTI